MKHTTLLFLVRDNEILLAMKKRGFGKDFWNGVGGKIEEGETIEQAAGRECEEEIGVKPYSLQKVARLTFSFADDTPDVLSHVFLARQWEGDPIETEEMAPRWFNLSDIPYTSMWPSDNAWLPLVLQGQKIVGHFDYESITDTMPQSTHLNAVKQLD